MAGDDFDDDRYEQRLIGVSGDIAEADHSAHPLRQPGLQAARRLQQRKNVPRALRRAETVAPDDMLPNILRASQARRILRVAAS